MLLLLSPAKTLDFTPNEFSEFSQPRLLEDSQILIDALNDKNAEQIKKLMGISDKLVNLNISRFKEFSLPFSLDNAKQSIFAFKGDVYTGLNAEDFSKEDLVFSQQCVRVLSGLYGLLRPFDLMQAYRLEMGTKLENQRGKNLYEFWGNKITNLLNKDLTEQTNKSIINLASQEYFKSVNENNLDGKLYNVHFKEERNGKLKIISFSAKKARGMMARYIVKNRIENPEDLKSFNLDNYIFNDEMSSEFEYLFTR